METAVITGAASGIGRALARKLFVDEGYNLVLIDQNSSALQSLRDELCPADDASPALAIGSISIHTCDISQPGAIDSIAQITAQRTGASGIQLLINSAGITYAGLFSRMDMGTFQKIVDVNLTGTARVIRAFLPLLQVAQKPTIVTIASLAGLIGAPGMAAYSASKFGLMGLSEALRFEFGETIQLCLVCPGFVRTGIARNALAESGDATEQRSAMDSWVQQFGASPEKVALKILRAVRSRKKILLISPETHVLHRLHSIAPFLSESLIARGFARIKKGAIVPGGDSEKDHDIPKT